MDKKTPSADITPKYSHHHFWIMVAIFFILTSIVGIAYPLWWNYRSSHGGKILVQRALPKTNQKNPNTCNVHTAGSTPTPQRPAILDIPAISMKAPVLQGVSNSVLDIAVGHSPTTVWPGTKGESILLAHDVSYFSNIDHLKLGDRIIWEMGCSQSVFKVVSTTISKPGATVSPPQSGTGLSLVTCWPTNALFWTTNRYVVGTQLVSQRTISPNISLPLIPNSQLQIPTIAGIDHKNLSFNKSGITLGKLSTTGSPTKSFIQSPSVLIDTNLVLQDYVQASKTAKLNNLSWWHLLALPQVQLPSYWPLSDTTNVELIIHNSNLKGAIVSSQAATITMVVKNNILLISKVSILTKSTSKS